MRSWRARVASVAVALLAIVGTDQRLTTSTVPRPRRHQRWPHLAEEQTMLWYCRFRRLPGATPEQVRQRLLLQHAAGTNQPERIRSWYNVDGGAAGFVMIEADDLSDVNAILDPYRDLLGWDVDAVVERHYHALVKVLLERGLVVPR
jgi:hypothetical protein